MQMTPTGHGPNLCFEASLLWAYILPLFSGVAAALFSASAWECTADLACTTNDRGSVRVLSLVFAAMAYVSAVLVTVTGYSASRIVQQAEPDRRRRLKYSIVTFFIVVPATAVCGILAYGCCTGIAHTSLEWFRASFTILIAACIASALLGVIEYINMVYYRDSPTTPTGSQPCYTGHRRALIVASVLMFTLLLVGWTPMAVYTWSCAACAQGRAMWQPFTIAAGLVIFTQLSILLFVLLNRHFGPLQVENWQGRVVLNFYLAWYLSSVGGGVVWAIAGFRCGHEHNNWAQTFQAMAFVYAVMAGLLSLVLVLFLHDFKNRTDETVPLLL